MFLFSVIIFHFLSANAESKVDPYSASFKDPYYMEICGSSQYREAKGNTGGPMGHAVLYLQGACLDETQSLPRLKFCSHNGTGISVNPLFSNARWVGVEGRDFFFKGELAAKGVIDEDAMKRVQGLAVSKHIYRGITINPNYGTLTEGLTPEEYIASKSAGTDYALSFARSFYCSRIPLKENMVMKVISALNEMNQSVADGSYQWDLLKDNCAHVVYNAAASVGLWSEKKVNKTFSWQQYYYVAIPVNSVLKGVEIMNDRQLWDPISLFADEDFRKPLLDFGYLPVRPRAYLTFYPIHQYANLIFDTQARFDVFDYPFLNINNSQFEKILKNPRYWSEEENRVYFQQIYAALYYELRPWPQEESSLKDWLVIPDFRIFLDTLKSEVDTILKTL